MDSPLVNDDEEDEHYERTWVAAHWIGCGREYHNNPPVVEAANLPDKNMSIAQLLVFEVPPIEDPMDDDTEWFLTEPASPDVRELVPLLSIPSRDVVQHLLNELGQAWFDGKQSLHTSINPEVALPFWVLTYWLVILDAAEAKDRWIAASIWSDKVGKTREELGMKRAVKDLWKKIAWHGNLPGFGSSLPVLDLAGFFSQDYLAGNLVDAMMRLLSVRLAESAGPVSNSTLVVDTPFAQYIELLHPDLDGIRPDNISPSALKYLDKYGSWFQSPDHTHLYFFLHRPPRHWTACEIDFKSKHIRYGDSLRWKRPQDFFDALDSFVAEQFAGAKFIVTDDLRYAYQTDGYNCPIIAVNTVAHNVLGDALWTPGTANGLRMKAFCEITEYTSSGRAKVCLYPPQRAPSHLRKGPLRPILLYE
ncbi:hypothetical protein DFH07DRAFT_959911 [Mycena maculata]|uniref:Ubiquitin-like protease family profile domain-containing protein n=1 Tax=Mycena maculata TaxID=230809 RepID=A0AAD7NCP4_9AGAR|nr:hypothetical protein DFH07DRAFT_959911 [Mycena maculata]